MKPLVLVFNLLCGADASTSHYAITQLQAKETHLPTQNPYVIDVAIASEAVAISTAAVIFQHDHPRLAKAMLVGAIIGRGYVVAHNLHEIRKGLR